MLGLLVGVLTAFVSMVSISAYRHCCQILFILGLYYTSPSVASIFQPAVPVFTTILAICTFTEPFPDMSQMHGWAKVLVPSV